MKPEIHYAICELSVVPLRREPSDKSEMTSQVICGERMQILEEQEKWFMVRLDHDGYEGWVDRKQISLINEPSTNKAVSLSSTFEVATTESGSLRVLPAGAMLYQVDQNTFAIAGKSLTLPDVSSKCKRVTDVIEFAERFIGTPYLWGGRTFMGIDCSGFTQIVMRCAGKNILRDAWQQAESGEIVSFLDESMSGDLAFFDNDEGRITHVGIVIRNSNGSTKIIHASGEVRVDALDHQGIFHESKRIYTHRLRIIRRIN